MCVLVCVCECVHGWRVRRIRVAFLCFRFHLQIKKKKKWIGHLQTVCAFHYVNASAGFPYDLLSLSRVCHCYFGRFSKSAQLLFHFTIRVLTSYCLVRQLVICINLFPSPGFKLHCFSRCNVFLTWRHFEHTIRLYRSTISEWTGCRSFVCDLGCVVKSWTNAITRFKAVERKCVLKSQSRISQRFQPPPTDFIFFYFLFFGFFSCFFCLTSVRMK